MVHHPLHCKLVAAQTADTLCSVQLDCPLVLLLLKNTSKMHSNFEPLLQAYPTCGLWVMYGPAQLAVWPTLWQWLYPCSAPGTPHSSQQSNIGVSWALTVWAETRAWERHSAVLTQLMANNFMHFDTLAKYNPQKSENYAAIFSVLIKKVENRLQDCTTQVWQ